MARSLRRWEQDQQAARDAADGAVGGGPPREEPVAVPVVEVTPETPDPVDTDVGPVLERPPLSGLVAEWRGYAESVGVDTTDLTKAEIIAAVDNLDAG